MKVDLSQTKMDLSHPLVPLLEILAEQGGEAKKTISGYFPKVRAVLRDYTAVTKKASLDKLTILDVISDTSAKVDLSPDLVKFIDEVSHRKDKDQIKSQIKGLLEVIFGSAYEEGVAVETSFVKSMLPEWMLGIWGHLPKNGDGLSPKSRHLLGILLHVVASHKASTAAALMVEMSDHLSEVIRDSYESRVWKTLDAGMSQLRKKLELTKPQEGREKSLSLERWPPTLRREWEAFEKMAEAGPSEQLLKDAHTHHVSLKQLEASTLRTYFEKVAAALYAIAWNSDLGLRDLLLIKSITVTEDGTSKEKLGNELIEDYRKQQQEPKTLGKAAGKDSQAFIALISVLKTMAGYHNLFTLREEFKAVYKAKADEETRRERREKEKAGYTQEFIDGEVERLHEDFQQIVGAKSFAVDEESLSLCLFFIAFITMRYMGCRQQAIRNCKDGCNIIFGSKGETITFYWPKAMVKTKRPISITLDKSVDKTHEMLINALWRFRQHVYPHIRKNQGQDLDGQFFVKADAAGRFICFKTHTNFYQWFSNASLKFLPLKGKIKGRKEGIHPHFLRGFAVDWLLGYGLSMAEVADLMNISEKTVRESYAGKETPVHTRSALNSLQRKRLEKETLQGGGIQMELVAEQVAGKVVKAMNKSAPAVKPAQDAGEREYIAKLEAAVAALTEEVAMLRQQKTSRQLSLEF